MSFRITIRGISSLPLDLEVRSTTTVAELRAATKSNWPTLETFELVWAGKILTNPTATLADVNIATGSTLHVVTSRAGGRALHPEPEEETETTTTNEPHAEG